MASPIEFRYYLRLFTLADAEAGVQPIRQLVGAPPTLKLFAPASLQWRARELAEAGGRQWGPWLDVLYSREGDDVAAGARADPPAAA